MLSTGLNLAALFFTNITYFFLIWTLYKISLIIHLFYVAVCEGSFRAVLHNKVPQWYCNFSLFIQIQDLWKREVTGFVINITNKQNGITHNCRRFRTTVIFCRRFAVLFSTICCDHSGSNFLCDVSHKVMHFIHPKKFCFLYA